MSSVDHEYYEYLMSQDKSDLAIEIMNLEMSSSNNRIAEFIKEKEELKQQLAEKEKEKEKELKHLKELKRLLNSLYGKTTMNRFQEIQRQYKISFTIEQLEKVKELLFKEIKQNPIIYDVTNDVVGGAVDRDRCFEIIDNQINELKGEK